MATYRLPAGVVCSVLAASGLGAAIVAPSAGADTYGSTPAERQFLSHLLVPQDWGAGHRDSHNG